MPLNDFTFSFQSSGEVEVSLAESNSSEKQNVTLEEKITLLFESQSEAIFRYLSTAFGSSPAEEIEDITQEAFLKLYQALQKGEEINNWRGWLFRVAHNTAIDRLRTQKFIAPIGEISWDEIREQIPDSALNPEQIVLKLEEMTLLHEAVKRLSMQERQCLHLRVEGFRYREIGEILGLATPTVGEFLRRAIKKLMHEFN